MSQSKKKETQKHVLFSLSYPSNVISITCKNPCHKAKNSVKPVERKASRSTTTTTKSQVLSEGLERRKPLLLHFLSYIRSNIMESRTRCSERYLWQNCR